MCGITGIVYTNRFGDPNDIGRMNDAIAHRGPDGEGFAAINSFSRAVVPLGGEKTPIRLPPLRGFRQDANVYLAHRRLSIIDLSRAGHQPMTNADETLWITFNGEIYNYKAIRSELRNDGFSFKSDTDTEVLLYAYQKWGEDCLDRIDGMFAFVIYDKRKNILFGARDRFGVKPLYYFRGEESFAFSSEIKGLLALDFIPRRVDRDVAYSFLCVLQEQYGERTFFEDIRELLPSHCFRYDLSDSSFSTRQYYKLGYNTDWEKFSGKRCERFLQEIKELLRDSVSSHINADVAVGSCLSGGIDSSAIVSMIHSLGGVNQACVTACYDQESVDESDWAGIVAGSVGADWHKVFPRKNELLDDLGDLVHSQELPFASTSIYAQYRVMKAAREAGITVMLDGQGGDELFCGYPWYYRYYYFNALQSLDMRNFARETRSIGNSPLRPAAFWMPLEKCVSNAVWRYSPASVRNEMQRRMVDIPSRYRKFKAGIFPAPYANSLNELLFHSMTRTSLPALLRYEDKNSMRFSIESRTPFADSRRLIEYVFSISGSYKIHNGWSKYLLRESMDGIMPAQIRKRVDKIGFATPESGWLGPLRDLVFSRRDTGVEQFIDMKALERDWETLVSKSNRAGVTKLWRYISFILWFNAFGCAR